MIEMASLIQTFCTAAKAVQKTGKVVSDVVDTYKNLRASLIDKDEKLESIIEDFEEEPEDKSIQGYLGKKLQASPALESAEVQALSNQLMEAVKRSNPQTSKSQSAQNIQGKVIQIQSGDNATFHNIS